MKSKALLKAELDEAMLRVILKARELSTSGALSRENITVTKLKTEGAVWYIPFSALVDLRIELQAYEKKALAYLEKCGQDETAERSK